MSLIRHVKKIRKIFGPVGHLIFLVYRYTIILTITEFLEVGFLVIAISDNAAAEETVQMAKVTIVFRR